ncbi:MAG: di-trans,poly-cis-decaprenylcistransferase [Candidatus Aenigmarchaeota archaeon]|nr:di-trans,poly-cis-decaprenylcistransferase [Candidatus Aenigmarchaeota archaeon]
MIPAHVGIIPDGNRRLAKRLMKTPWKGHEWGIEKIRDVMDWCKDLKIRTLTFYVLSLENLEKRPKRELNYLFSLAKKELNDVLNNPEHIAHKNRTRINFIGKLDVLPEDLQAIILKVAKMTEGYDDHILNLAIAYGGRQEITQAMERIAEDVKKGKFAPSEVNDPLIRSYLYTNGYGDPDLIIRTGGERRLSNFLPYQSVYSELVFMDVFWPEMDKRDFSKAIRDFESRQRRFGK